MLSSALLHDSIRTFLLLQTAECRNAVALPKYRSRVPYALILGIPSLYADYVSMHAVREARHIWECLSKHLSAMRAIKHSKTRAK